MNYWNRLVWATLRNVFSKFSNMLLQRVSVISNSFSSDVPNPSPWSSRYLKYCQPGGSAKAEGQNTKQDWHKEERQTTSPTTVDHSCKDALKAYTGTHNRNAWHLRIAVIASQTLAVKLSVSRKAINHHNSRQMKENIRGVEENTASHWKVWNLTLCAHRWLALFHGRLDTGLPPRGVGFSRFRGVFRQF